MESILQVNRKVNRAIAASAAALGAKVHLRDVPGYWPRKHPQEGIALMREAMEQVLENVNCGTGWGTGCSDMGDVGAVMPALHPTIGGASGTFHGNTFRIVDPETACVQSAQVQLVFLAMALADGGRRAKEIIENYKPVFGSMQEYFDFVDKLNLDQDAVAYEGEHKAILCFGEE